jgi:MFS family permease
MSQTAPAAPGQPWPAPAYAWYVLAVIAFGYVFAFIDRIIVGLLTPDIQKSLHISDTQAGLLQGLAFALFYTLFGLPLGWLTDRSNRQRILAAGMTVWSVMTAACGLPSTFWPLFAARVGVGVGEATLNPCASSLIADYFPPHERPKAFGFYTMATAFASILSYLIGSGVLAWLRRYETIPVPGVGALQPWQFTFVFLGLAGLIPALLFAFTVREPARRGLSSRAASADLRATLAFLRANRTTYICLMLGISLVILEVYGAAYWLPTIFLRQHGWSPVKTGIYLGLFQASCGVIGSAASGYVTTWLKDRGIAEGVWLMGLAGAVACTLFGAAAPLMPSPWLLLALSMLKALFVNFPPAAALTAMAEITPNEHRGKVTAVYVIMTGLFAQGLGPLMVGVITDSVFGVPEAVGKSLSLLVASTGLVGIGLLIYGRSAYRRSLAAVTWEAAAR